jgi:hypothetical protein
MKANVRRIIEMSKRVLNFSKAHPDPSQGYTAALARLEKAVAEADVLAARQRDGINASRAATGQKRALRRKIRRTQLVHLARVAESAAAEVPELAEKFRLTREAVPYLAFRTAARGMSAEAQSQKELLVKHGLLDSVLESLSHNLDEFDRAVEQGTDARRTHVGASAELDALAEELTQVVRLMDGINRTRSADDPDSLAQWQSASNIIGPPRPGIPAAKPGSAGQSVDTGKAADGSKGVDHAA